jgi:outer membrane protein assembly factor BamB
MTHLSLPRRVPHGLLWCWIALAAAPALAQEWTRFRGPNGSGQSEAKIPAQWSDADFNWKVTLPGSGHSSPVLWGDKIFITSADMSAGERYVLCLSAADGHEIWRKSYPFDKHHVHDQNSYATSTPAVDADRVYVVWANPKQCTLYALSHDGKDLWHNDLGSFTSQHGFASSPIVYKDLVILGDEQDGPNPESGGNPATASLDGKSCLWAIDRETGETRWKTPRKSTIVAYATPCLYESESGKTQLIFDSRSHGMSGIDPDTGKVLWELPLFEQRPVGSPFVLGRLVLGTCGVGNGNNSLVAVDPEGSGKKPRVAYKIDRSSAPYVPTPVAAGNLVFLWTDRGVITCIDGLKGDVKWREHPAGEFSSSPVRAGDKIFCIAINGDVSVIAASDKYQLLAKNSLHEMCRSTPAIAGGRMYVRTASHLMSIGGKN